MSSQLPGEVMDAYVVIKVSVCLVQSVGALKSILTGHFDCLNIRLSAKN